MNIAEFQGIVRTELTVVTRRLDRMEGKLDSRVEVCTAHGERLAALEQHAKNGTNGNGRSRGRAAVQLSIAAGGGAALVKLLEVLVKALSS